MEELRVAVKFMEVIVDNATIHLVNVKLKHVFNHIFNNLRIEYFNIL